MKRSAPAGLRRCAGTEARRLTARSSQRGLVEFTAGLVLRRAIAYLVALLLGAGAVLWLFYQQDMAEHAACLAGISKAVRNSIRGGRLREQGQGAPVLIIHGAGGFRPRARMVGPLAEHGFRLIAPSRFG